MNFLAKQGVAVCSSRKDHLNSQNTYADFFWPSKIATPKEVKVTSSESQEIAQKCVVLVAPFANGG